MARRRSGAESPALPDPEQIREFLAARPDAGRRDIARHFGIRGQDRAVLRRLLRELEDDGAIGPVSRRRRLPPGALPPVAVIAVTGPDADGELAAVPARWPHRSPAPPIRLAGDRRRSRPAPAAGDRLLARLEVTPDGAYEARTIRRLPAAPTQALGVVDTDRHGLLLVPAERGGRTVYRLVAGDPATVRPGELVRADILPDAGSGQPRARIRERLGDSSGPGAGTRIAIHAAGIPTDFADAAAAQAAAARPAAAGDRVDFRGLPLVTIDGPDARDFDDAVYAEPAPGGWRVVVAVADVAWYVRAGDALDREALRRGNSVYFPDRVVPMLPEQLSAGLCSLRPGEDRACIAVEMHVGDDGTVGRHRFRRGLMRSAARLTYDEVQAARDGRAAAGAAAAPAAAVIAPLYGAWAALAAARSRRGALDLDLPERTVSLAPDGSVAAVGRRDRLDSHRLIEELMIAANVAAAETLERRRLPCMYRVHDAPDRERVAALADALRGFGIPFARARIPRPALFNRVIEQARGRPGERIVSDLVLRAQAQAVYSPENGGHFGLGLRRYAHFTSPIRRYADLLVHRAILATLGRGDGPRDGALAAQDGDGLAATGEHLSMTERRAAGAERAAVDRCIASFLAARTGEVFAGTVAGVTRAGLFVRLAGTGADGLVPISTIGAEYFRCDPARAVLTGQSTGIAYRLGQEVTVRLVEADPLTGSLRLQLASAGGRRRG